MGCGVSKIDPSGATTLPAKLRPIFLRRLEEIKKRRHAQPLKDSTPSKKELLLHDRDEEDNASHFSSSDDTSKNVPPPTKDGPYPSKNEPLPTGDGENSVGKFESLKGKDPTKPTGKDEMFVEFTPKTKGDNTKIEGKIENILTNKDDSEYEDGEHDKERMISHNDDDAFPSSPSFRIYFTNGMDDDQIDSIRKNDALRDACLSDEKTSLKKLPVKKRVKRGIKMQSFRNVLPKGGQSTVKNLLNVKSCYNPSHSARDRVQLLTAKTV